MGKTLVVGIQSDPSSLGSAVVYRYSQDEGSFVQQGARLFPGDGQPGDDFGRSVAVSGDYALIGAQRHNSENIADSGAAYVYQRVGGQWSEAAKLTAPLPSENERFGISVSMHDGMAVVGANGNDANGENSGAAYVFSLGNDRRWNLAQSLRAPDGEAGDSYGFSVAVHGERIVVGSVWDLERRGSAYVYGPAERGGWAVEGKFTAAGGAPDDQFGWSVDVHDDTVAVGAFSHDADGDEDSGAVYVFALDPNGVWRQQARIAPPDGGEDDHFGRSIGLEGDFLIASAPLDDDSGTEAGAAYIYRRDGGSWLFETKLGPTEVNNANFNEFGYGVGASKDFFVASSKFSDRVADCAGTVYVYDTYRPGAPTHEPTGSSTGVVTLEPTPPPVEETTEPTSSPSDSTLEPPPASMEATSGPTSSPGEDTAAPTQPLPETSPAPTSSPSKERSEPTSSPSLEPSTSALTPPPSEATSESTPPSSREGPFPTSKPTATSGEATSVPTFTPSSYAPTLLNPTYNPTYGPTITMPTYSPSEADKEGT